MLGFMRYWDGITGLETLVQRALPVIMVMMEAGLELRKAIHWAFYYCTRTYSKAEWRSIYPSTSFAQIFLLLPTCNAAPMPL